MREIRTLRATGRGLETGPWQAGLRRRLRKGRLQPPEAYRYRASPRPYRQHQGGEHLPVADLQAAEADHAAGPRAPRRHRHDPGQRRLTAQVGSGEDPPGGGQLATQGPGPGHQVEVESAHLPGHRPRPEEEARYETKRQRLAACGESALCGSRVTARTVSFARFEEMPSIFEHEWGGNWAC